MIRTSVLASLVAAASAMCAGEPPCSGHGSCGTYDKCTCYRNWQGEDCSERTCPYETSFTNVASDGVEWSHPYTECSSKGTCDRSSGVCECFDGYDGVGCRRMVCEEDCNGHGTCESMNDVSTGSYTGWDAHKIQMCVCDPGYEGDKCENRQCKKGDDPITLTAGTSATFQVNEEQSLAFSGASGSFTIKYTDWRGRTWETWGLDSSTITAGAVEEALEALPNSAIPDVTVSGTVTTGTGTLVVTFDGAATAGDQLGMTLGLSGCNSAGCQPNYAGGSGITISTTTAGTEEWNVCSDRGTCDTDSGLCQCFSGFSGERCDIQTVIV